MGAPVVGPPPGARRVRQPLNCTACRERKIRCDRTIPCSQCIRRGIANNCYIEDRRGQLARRAKPADHKRTSSDIHEHLAHIERLIQHSHAGTPPLSVFANVPETPVLVQGRKAPEPRPECPGVEEDAIARFEKLALCGSVADDSTQSQTPPLEPREQPGMLASVETGPLTMGSDSQLGWGLGWAFGAALNDKRTDFPPEQQVSRHYDLIPDRGKVISIILDTIPPKRIVDVLLTVFERRLLSLVYNVVHVVLLRKELDEFFLLPRDECVRRLDTGDTCWLGVVLLVLGLSAQFMPPGAALDPEYSAHVTARHVRQWHSAARSVLIMSELLSAQRLSVLQTVVLLAFQSSNMARTSLLRIAITNAQHMGIHRLGDKARMPLPDDPPEKVLRWELGARVWWALVLFDWRPSLNDLTPFSVTPRQFNTPPPRNYNDIELIMSPVPPPHGTDEYTDVSFLLANIEHIKITFDIKMRLNDLLMQQAQDDIPHNISFPEVQEFDVRLRAVVDRSPAVLGSVASSAPCEAVEVQRWLLHLTVFTSLLHLHRPHIAHKKARFCCIELARSILSMQHSISSHNDLVQMMHYSVLQIFPAALLLCLDMLQVPQTEPQRATMRQEIIDSLDTLRTAEFRYRGYMRVARIIEILLEKEEAQWEIIRHQTGILQPLPRNLVQMLECVAAKVSSPGCEGDETKGDTNATGHTYGTWVPDTAFGTVNPSDLSNNDINVLLGAIGNPGTNDESVPQPYSAQDDCPTQPHTNLLPFSIASDKNALLHPTPAAYDALSTSIMLSPQSDAEADQKNNELWDWFLDQGAIGSEAQAPLDFSSAVLGNTLPLQVPIQPAPQAAPVPQDGPVSQAVPVPQSVPFSQGIPISQVIPGQVTTNVPIPPFGVPADISASETQDFNDMLNSN